MTYEERFAAGTEALRANDAQTAIQHLRACVEENSSDPRALLYLGIAYGLAEDYTAAEGCLLQAVRIDPGSTQARFNLARLRHRQGRLQEALEDYLATLRIDPTHEKAQSEADRLAAELGAGAAPEPPHRSTSKPMAPPRWWASSGRPCEARTSSCARWTSCPR